MVASRAQLLYLLAEAAEIEHALMCTYLYAAFSLKRPEDGLAGSAAEAVDRWRGVITGIAVEEMGHLLTVANLTVAIGGRPHFNRPNFPVSPGYFPSGVVVRLAPFSRETLDHFVFLERPPEADDTDSPAFATEAEYERAQPHRGLMPSAQEYATIGRLYEAIRDNLSALADHVGEERLFLGAAADQIGREVVALGSVTPICDLPAALAAIDTIIVEGEGSAADRETSHYHRFLAIRDEFDALTAADPGFAPALPAATSPVLRPPPEPGDLRLVDDPQAVALLDFTCATYGLLLRLLVQCFARPAPGAASGQKALMAAAIELMHVVGSCAERLARLPASPEAPEVNAGMSFTMLRGVEPFVLGRPEQHLIREHLADLAGGARSLRMVPEPVAARLARMAETFSLARDGD